MRLLSFHADGFGILAQTGAEDLGPGINIFLGDNDLFCRSADAVAYR